MADSFDRIEQSGDAFYQKGGGFVTASKPKSKNGDESAAMAATLGSGMGSWGAKLNDGCDDPYPPTQTALKTKNTRKNNDSFPG